MKAFLTLIIAAIVSLLGFGMAAYGNNWGFVLAVLPYWLWVRSLRSRNRA